jgi:hypothetical protein
LNSSGVRQRRQGKQEKNNIGRPDAGAISLRSFQTVLLVGESSAQSQME